MKNYFSENYPFKPSISDKSQPKLGNFMKRLETWVEKYKNVHTKLQEKANYDSSSGLPLYKPQTGKIRDNSQSRDLFQELHQDRVRRDKLKEDYNQKAEEEIKKRAKSRSSITKTDDINNKHKDECFANLFVALDEDSDGIITYTENFLNNAKTKICENVLSLLEPLIEELKEHNETLTYEEFVLALNQLFIVLNVEQKRRILNWYTAYKRENSPVKRFDQLNVNKGMTFRPNISEATINLFKETRRFSSKSFLERNNELLESRDKHSSLGKQLNLEDELKGKK